MESCEGRPAGLPPLLRTQRSGRVSEAFAPPRFLWSWEWSPWRVNARRDRTARKASQPLDAQMHDGMMTRPIGQLEAGKASSRADPPSRQRQLDECLRNHSPISKRSRHVKKLSAVSHQPSAISYQPSAVSYQPSAVSYQPSAVSHQPSAISHQPSACRGRLVVTRYRRRVPARGPARWQRPDCR